MVSVDSMNALYAALDVLQADLREVEVRLRDMSRRIDAAVALGSLVSEPGEHPPEDGCYEDVDR